MHQSVLMAGDISENSVTIRDEEGLDLLAELGASVMAGDRHCVKVVMSKYEEVCVGGSVGKLSFEPS